MKIETYLPVFHGFYGSIWEFDYDMVLYNINENRRENGLAEIDSDALELNYREYEIDVCKKLCPVTAEHLKEFVHDIKYQELRSPREYNFYNDSVNCVIDANVDAIKAYLEANYAAFSEFLKGRYTSCDGFISYYSNQADDWKADTKGFTDFSINGHVLGSVLDFIAGQLKIDSLELYYDVMENIDTDEYVTNWEAVTK